MKGFYVHIETRSQSSTKKGTAKQAIEYITDDHDTKRIASISEEMIRYIARIDSGYKTDHEGGPVELVGHGFLANRQDNNEMREIFYSYTQPPLNNEKLTTGTVGYKSGTFTFPKEMTLLCETDKKKAREAITKAIEETLAYAYKNKQIAAVSAMHTRNVAGDPHINVHVLVGKFAIDKITGKQGSLNNADFYEDKNARDAPKLKLAWTNAITRELGLAFNVHIRFDKDEKCYIEPDGKALITPLKRATVREKQRAWLITNAKTYTDPKGNEKIFQINMMDARILEVATKINLTKENYLQSFPKAETKWETIEKRIQTLQKMEYLDKNLRPTQIFKEHAEIKFGDRPEWAAIRLEVDKFICELMKKSTAEKYKKINLEPPKTTDQQTSSDEQKIEAKDEKMDTISQIIPQMLTSFAARGTKEDDIEKEKSKTSSAPQKLDLSKEIDIANVTNDQLVQLFHDEPLRVARLDPDLNKRITEMESNLGRFEQIQAEWVYTRQEPTPEVIQWAKTEDNRIMHNKKIQQQAKNMGPRQKADYLIGAKPIQEHWKKTTELASQLAHRSLYNEHCKEHKLLLNELVRDHELKHSIDQKLLDLEAKMKLLDSQEKDDKTPYYKKIIQNQIRELIRTQQKMKAEIYEKQLRAYRIEHLMVQESPRFKEITKQTIGSRLLSDRHVRILEDLIFTRKRTTVRDYVTNPMNKQLGVDAHNLRRGAAVLQIMGAKEEGILKTFRGHEKLMLKQLAQKQLSTESAVTVIRAKRIGETLERADFNLLHHRPFIPQELNIPSLEKKYRLLVARTQSLGLPFPDNPNITLKQFTKAIEKNVTLQRLTSEGSKFIIDFKVGDSSKFQIALDLLKAENKSISQADNSSAKSIKHSNTNIQNQENLK